MTFVPRWLFIAAIILTARLADAFTAPFSNTGRRSFVLQDATNDLQTSCQNLEKALDPCRAEIAKSCKVAVAPTENRLGLVAISKIKKGEVVLAMPYDDRVVLSPTLARKEVFAGILPDRYEGWTGDAGLIALLILNEVAKASGSGGLPLPKRSPAMDQFMAAWVSCLPSPTEMVSMHPLMWPEEDQEVLQQSSTKKIYQTLDDCDEDSVWLDERIWKKDTKAFPASVTVNGKEFPCFNAEGFKWAMALAQSRCVFVDGSLRLIPLMDMCNHNDEGGEVTGGTMGTFGTTKGAQLVATKAYAIGEEIICSYGPKSAADYLLENGFCPPQVFKTNVAELSFALDSEDRFHDDKLDILEFETYDLAPMDPEQSFDAVSEPGRDGEPDPAMIQFVRLCKLGGTDAFLLESIFRKEIWGFMSEPVSEPNELAVTDAVINACQKALDDLEQAPAGGPEVCLQLRESEVRALTRTMEFLQGEKEALDLKEYYQERRLKDLGLDSQWSPEDDVDPDLDFGQTRAPGAADYDW